MLPWQWISHTSSPVLDLGSAINKIMASSIISLSTRNRVKQKCPAVGQFAANSEGVKLAFGPDVRITAIAERPGGVATAKIVSKEVISVRFTKFKVSDLAVVKWNTVHNKNLFYDRFQIYW